MINFFDKLLPSDWRENLFCDFFCARQLPSSPDVTSQTLIYAFTSLAFHLTCFSLEEGKLRKLQCVWLFLDVSQVRVHFNKLIREFLPHYRFLTYLRAILDSTDTNVFNRMFSFVIGRSFDHIFEFQIRTHCLLFIRPLDLNHPQH